MDSGRTELINAALLYANQDTILDSDGESKNAKLCAQFYDTTLQEALSGHPWSFALVAAKLNLLASKPRDFRFAYAYQLPTNFGYMQYVSAADLIEPRYDNAIAQEMMALTGDKANSIPIPEYIVQGSQLYSNYLNIQIVYSRTDVKPFEMTPQFRNYFAALLAAKLYIKMTGGVDGYQELQKRVILIRAEARHTDSTQTDTLAPNRPNLFVRAREY